MSKVSYIPKDYNTITPYLIVKGAAQAIDYYKKVFGATELFRMNGPDGKVGHAELKIGTSHIMLADENPKHGARAHQRSYDWREPDQPLRLPS
ncbi:MAG TPA: VOC family protein [Candidatus Solibacter sp.]|nr:VOC family protein [Candidatus Solibacter sp.]